MAVGLLLMNLDTYGYRTVREGSDSFKKLFEAYPPDVYNGRDKQILKNRNLMKQKTMYKRRKLHLLNCSKV